MDPKFKKMIEDAITEFEPDRFEGKRVVVIDEENECGRSNSWYHFEAAMRVKGWVDTIHLEVAISTYGEINVEETGIGSHPLDSKFPSPMPFEWSEV